LRAGLRQRMLLKTLLTAPSMTPRNLLAAIAALQVRLQQDQLHLAAARPGALHDLRVGLRQLRSLLKPLDSLDVFVELATAAQRLAEKTGPARDQEVLLAELAEWHPDRVAAWQAGLGHPATGLTHAPELAACNAAFANFTSLVSWHDLPEQTVIARHFKTARRRWQKQICGAIIAMNEPPENLPAETTNTRALNRHALRLLIKRLRYTLEWQRTPGAAPLLRQLKACQARIGEWHDRCNWITAVNAMQTTQPDPALAHLVALWQSELTFHADSADAALRRLEKYLVRAAL
jgi:CHAD domain-containing protein